MCSPRWAEDREELARPGRGGIAEPSARPSAAGEDDAVDGAAALSAPRDHRHPGRVAELHGAPDQRPRGGAGDQRADQVTGKENLLFRVAEATVDAGDRLVRDTVFPVASQAVLRDLVTEFKSSGPTYQRTVKATLRASYTNHYRAGLIKLLSVLDFRSNNTTHRPLPADLQERSPRAGLSPRSVRNRPQYRCAVPVADQQRQLDVQPVVVGDRPPASRNCPPDPVFHRIGM